MAEKELDPGEKLLWEGHTSVLVYQRELWIALLLALTGVGLLYGLYLRAKARNTRYRLTDQRLQFSEGVFSRRAEHIELYRIRDIELREPWALRCFGLGEVVIWSADVVTPRLVISGIADAGHVRELLRSAVETLRDRKGIRALEVAGNPQPSSR